MGKTTFLSNAVLDHVLGKANLSAITPHLALFTAAPTDAGGGTEVSGGSYARVAITSLFGTASGESSANTSDVTFAQATANWGTVVATGILDASSAGNLLEWSWLVAAWKDFVALAATDTFHSPAHGFANDSTVVLSGDNLPTGVDGATIYYVVNTATDTFQLSASQGGSAINLTTNGSGIAGIQVSRAVISGDTPKFLTGNLTLTEE